MIGEGTRGGGGGGGEESDSWSSHSVRCYNLKVPVALRASHVKGRQ